MISSKSSNRNISSSSSSSSTCSWHHICNQQQALLYHYPVNINLAPHNPRHQTLTHPWPLTPLTPPPSRATSLLPWQQQCLCQLSLLNLTGTTHHTTTQPPQSPTHSLHPRPPSLFCLPPHHHRWLLCLTPKRPSRRALRRVWRLDGSTS
jgi:hypothetical protein